MNVDAYVDGYNENPLAQGTRIFVREITFTGFALKGALNLNNSEAGADKAYWLDYNGAADLESGENVTIYDGRKDGKEGAAGSVASNEKTLGLNPQFVQDAEWGSEDLQAGVTNVPAPLFRKYDADDEKYVASDAPLLVIPTGEDIEVEIVYDVETADPNLATYLSDKKTTGSSIENRIKKNISFGGANFESGKHYTLNLHLGMNSVKFDAAVGEWQEAGVTPDADLPSNVPSFAASASTNPTEYTSAVEIDHNTDKYLFAVTGLNGGEGVTCTQTLGTTVKVNSKADFTGNVDAASSTGIAYIEISGIVENGDVLDKETAAAVTVQGNASSLQRVIDIKQLAQPLGLKVEKVSKTMIYLASENMPSLAAAKYQVEGSDGTASYVKVIKNGTELTQADNNPPADGEFYWYVGGHAVKLGHDLAPGDIYLVTLKTGDTYEETVQVKIGGISYPAGTEQSITYGQADQKVIAPAVFGEGTVAYESGATDVATISEGVITTVKAGTSTITATITPDANSSWFFVGTTAKYDLTVEKAEDCELKYTVEGNTKVKAADFADGFDLTSVISLLTSNGVALEAGSSATDKGGALSFEITKETLQGTAPTGTTRYKIEGNLIKHTSTFAAQVNRQAQAGDVIKVTAKVDATDNGNVSYATDTVSFTIKVK